jgi:hypothetical protein
MTGALLVEGALAAVAVAVAAVLFPVALIALATRRSRPRLRRVLVALGAVLVVSAVGILWLAPGSGADVRSIPLWLGAPPGLWVAAIGLGLVPFLIVVWSHAATFARNGARGRGTPPRD